jgi:hypothetical protein
MSQRKRHKWARSFKQQFWELNATQNTTVATDMEVLNTISTPPPPNQQTERERERERVEELRGKKKSLISMNKNAMIWNQTKKGFSWGGGCCMLYMLIRNNLICLIVQPN